MLFGLAFACFLLWSRMGQSRKKAVGDALEDSWRILGGQERTEARCSERRTASGWCDHRLGHYLRARLPHRAVSASAVVSNVPMRIDLPSTVTVARMRLHDARHSCASSMHARNVPIATIAPSLGHARAAFTMAVYAHSQDDALKAAATSFSRVVMTFGDTEAASDP